MAAIAAMLWCLKAGLQIFDCNYFTKAQCDMSASARRVWCVVNPFAVEQGYDPLWAQGRAHGRDEAEGASGRSTEICRAPAVATR